LLIYHVPLKDIFGRNKKEMERRIEEYDCAEQALLLKTYQGIRQRLMARELQEEKAALLKGKEKKEKVAVKTKGAPPVYLV
jgi:hypothetical protein